MYFINFFSWGDAVITGEFYDGESIHTNEEAAVHQLASVIRLFGTGWEALPKRQYLKTAYFHDPKQETPLIAFISLQREAEAHLCEIRFNDHETDECTCEQHTWLPAEPDVGLPHPRLEIV